MGLRRRFFFALLAAVAVPAALLPSPAAAATWTQVATGLHSPRGVAFLDGRLLVAEAGLGNPGGVIGKECFLDPAAGKVCIGATGRISWIDSGVRTTLVDGLFSETARGGFDVEGPAGLSIGEEEQILAQIGTPPQEVPAPPVLSGETFEFGQAQAGRLIAIKVNGTWRTVARVGEFDFNYTLQFPMAAQEHDANPYGLLATDDGVYVADAGSNTLDRVGEGGKVTVVIHDGFLTGQFFPHDSVPTCMVRTEDGLLVGELSGRVLEVHGTSFTVINNALFTHITGCTSDGRGNVYFVNMFGPGPFLSPSWQKGNVVKYNTESGQASLLADQLFFPNMDTIGPDGNLYVSTGSNCPSSPLCGGATGGVIKINLPHDEEGD